MIILAIMTLAGLVAMTYYGYQMVLEEKSNSNASTASLEVVMASSPAVRIDLNEGEFTVSDKCVTYFNGTAQVSVLDDDANTTDKFDVRFEQFDIPVPTGMAAAADVDGLKRAMVYVIRGTLDSVDFEFSSGARAASQNL
jgi:hypothetical protein